MSPGKAQTQYLSSFVNALYKSGATTAVICPGSRSTPMALTLQRHGDIQCYVLIDERSAGFFALGAAKASGRPTILLSTSGTAAANFMPAVVEAFWAHIPLIVLTADRPPELRDSGASQTIDQVRLYGRHVKWFQDMPTAGGAEVLDRFAAIAAGRSVYEALTPPQGPVHLNFPFREPLVIDVPDPGRGVDIMQPRVIPSILSAAPQEIHEIAHSLRAFRHGLILAGPGFMRPVLDHILRLSHVLQWPIFADPLSNIRGLNHRIFGTYDSFLRIHPDTFPAPECVIRLGAPMTSKALNRYTENSWIYSLDGDNSYREPQLQKGQVISGQIEPALRELTQNLTDLSIVTDSQWYQFWQQNHENMLVTLQKKIGRLQEPAEPYLYYHLVRWIKPLGPLDIFVSNSMPIRDLDTFTQDPDENIQFWANRGANGIDGIISTTMGIAAVHSQAVLVTGDLAFYHDMNGLLAATKYHLNVLVIVINNNGGGIFSFLPQSKINPTEFEALFGTPHGLSFEPVASLYQAQYRRAEAVKELDRAITELVPLKGLRILEWRTVNRSQNVILHEKFWQT